MSPQETAESILNQIGKLGMIPTITDPETRRVIHKSIAQIVNYSFPYKFDMADQLIMQEIQNFGVISVPDAISEIDLVRINSYFENLDGYNAHVPVYSDGQSYKYEKSYPFPVLSYSPKASLLCNELLSLLLNPEIINIAATYLGCFPTLYSLNTYRTFPNKNYDTHAVHRDHDDFKFLTFFIYLCDVDETTGPFFYYPKTHIESGVSDSIIFKGKKDTLVFADTYGLHHGSIPLKEPRFACWFRYGAYLNGAYYGDQNFKHKVNISSFQRNFSPEEKYLLRGFLENA